MTAVRSDKPHDFEVSPYDTYCCHCRMSQNYWKHQPFWWRFLFPLRTYR